MKNRVIGKLKKIDENVFGKMSQKTFNGIVYTVFAAVIVSTVLFVAHLEYEAQAEIQDASERMSMQE
jgi:cell division protein FtsL